MNHAKVYSYDLAKKTWKQITKVNNETYAKIVFKTENVGLRLLMVKDVGLGNFTSNFDKIKISNAFILPRRATKALTQSYSFRWNFQLMASRLCNCSTKS